MVIHVVQPGDSLYRIAQLHSVPLTFLIQQNELHEPYRLTPGQTIVVPQPESSSTDADTPKTNVLTLFISDSLFEITPPPAG